MDTPTGHTGLTDVATLRKRARAHPEQGAVTPGYAANRSEVLHHLNAALATELICVLRYRRHHFMVREDLADLLINPSMRA